MEIHKNDGSIVYGYLSQDKPGEYIIITKELDNDILLIPYSEIYIIRPKEKKDVKDLKTKPLESETVVPPEIIPEVQSIPDVKNIEKIIPEIINDQSETLKLISNKMDSLSLFDLYKLNVGEIGINQIDSDSKLELYGFLKKDDTLKFTLLNVVPGLGSILQGDYYAGVYTITSVLTTVLYNIAYNNTGNDYYFIINLNGIISYATSFLAPLRYNDKYNKTLKDKLTL